MNEKLTMDELQYVQNEVKLKGKNLGISYAVLTFFGFFGVHYSYLEKGKIALIRIMLTVITLASLYPIKGIIYTSETEGITVKLQMYSSSLLVLQISLLTILAAWTIYDFIKLTTMVRIKNEQIENEAKEKALQSRNVVAKIREEEVSKVMIEKISKNIEKEIKVHSEEIVKDFSKKLEELNETKIQEATIEKKEVTEPVEFELMKSQEIEQIEPSEEEVISIKSEDKIEVNNPILEEIGSSDAEIEEVKSSAEETYKTTKDKNSITVNEALNKKNGQFTVKGYIIGCLDSRGKEIYTNESNSNLLIADNPGESKLDKTLVIQVTEDLKENFGLQSNPSLIGSQIVAEGRIKNYYGKKGLKNVSQIKFNE